MRLSVLPVLASLVLVSACSCARSAPAAASADGASWRVTNSGVEERGLQALSGGDGVTTFATRAGSRVLTLKSGTTPPAAFLYFRLTRRPVSAAGPVFVSVEYYDDAIGTPLTLHYDSATGEEIGAKYLGADDQAGGWALGSNRWRTAVFLLRKPRFAGRENLGADFRLAGGPLTIRSVRLSRTRPAIWAQAARVEAKDVKQLVKIGPGGQLIVGGFDPAKPSDAVPASKNLEGSVPALKSLGVTSHEGYVRWNLCEPQDGKFDWSVYDRFVDVYKRHGLKWVPFIIVGSPYSLPDWYYKKPGSQGYVCLEHGQESDVQSLWNPELKKHVARFLRAFCDHYGKTGVIESILLGITGNYGEAIYPATGNDWTADIHGSYHTHPGYWAGDKYAVESFRIWLMHKYGGATPLRDAWGPAGADINKVKPFLKQDAPNERAWLDFCDWYISSMTDWARFWLSETRKDFPRGDIYLCTGGDATPQHGSDFAEQCKAAAESGAGVRITNEGSDYRANFSLTRWVASAGEQYGAYYSFEPAGAVDVNGVVARIYNATASGARGLHYYYPNLYGSKEAYANFVREGAKFTQRKPVVEIAVYYPETSIRLNGQDFLRYVQPLRDRFDFDFMSDRQIADGGLKRVKALVLLQGNIAEASTWKAIADWVDRGGLVLYPTGMGTLQTPERDTSWQQAVLRPVREKGRALTFEGTGDAPAYRQFVSRALASAPELSPASRAMVAADGEEDNVFVTLAGPNELLWLNYTGSPVSRNGITLPANTIVSQPATK